MLLLAHKKGVAEPSEVLSLPRVALAVALLSGADTKILVEDLPGSLPEAECSTALLAIPAVVSVAFVPATTAAVGHASLPESGKQEESGTGVGSVSTGVSKARSAVVEVATAAAVQPLVSHLEMIKVGGCEVRARRLLEPSEAEAAVQALIDAHEKQLVSASNGITDAAVATGAAALEQDGAVGNAHVAEGSSANLAAATGVLRLVKALRYEELEGQQEGVMHDVRCVVAQYGDVVDVGFSTLDSHAAEAEKALCADLDAPAEAADASTGAEAGPGGSPQVGGFHDIVVHYTSCQAASRAAMALQGRMLAERPLVAVVDSC